MRGRAPPRVRERANVRAGGARSVACASTTHARLWGGRAGAATPSSRGACTAWDDDDDDDDDASRARTAALRACLVWKPMPAAASAAGSATVTSRYGSTPQMGSMVVLAALMRCSRSPRPPRRYSAAFSARVQRITCMIVSTSPPPRAMKRAPVVRQLCGEQWGKPTLSKIAFEMLANWPVVNGSPSLMRRNRLPRRWAFAKVAHFVTNCRPKRHRPPPRPSNSRNFRLRPRRLARCASASARRVDTPRSSALEHPRVTAPGRHVHAGLVPTVRQANVARVWRPHRVGAPQRARRQALLGLALGSMRGARRIGVRTQRLGIQATGQAHR